MTVANNQSVYYVVMVVLKYSSFADAQEKAGEKISAHVKRSKVLHEQGSLLMSGAFVDKTDAPLSTMAVLTSSEAAEDYIKGDPFYLSGMMETWTIREWANMFA